METPCWQFQYPSDSMGLPLTRRCRLGSTTAAELLKQKDLRVIVIDEVIGLMIANYLAPARLAPLILGFLLFRCFDIAKVFPAARLEKLPGGTGIVLDDVVAGLYAFVIVQSALYWEWL